MAGSTGPNLGLLYGWAFRESGWKTGMDANLKLLDCVVGLSIISRSLTAPHGSPSAGDRYIVATGGTGAWAGQDGKLAVYRDSAWEFYTVKKGWSGFDAVLGKPIWYSGTAWVDATGATV